MNLQFHISEFAVYGKGFTHYFIYFNYICLGKYCQDTKLKYCPWLFIVVRSQLIFISFFEVDYIFQILHSKHTLLFKPKKFEKWVAF